MSTATSAERFWGQLGHLTEEQGKAFEDFKRRCAGAGLITLASAERRASHEDIDLIRFLRARKFVVEDAFKQFSDAVAWRAEEKVDHWYENFDVEDFEQAHKLHPQWTGRRDKDGRPLYVYSISHVAGPELSAHTNSANKAMRLVTLNEHITQFVLPLSNAARKDPASEISSFTIITDVSHVGFWQFWNLKGHMQATAKLAADRYPETLYRQFLVGTPAFFPTVWGWIKKWFDPVQVSKITILPGGMDPAALRKELQDHIDLADVPKKYGGTLEWDYGDPPKPDAELAKLLFGDRAAAGEVVDALRGPIKWVVDEKGRGHAEAVGSMNGKERRVTLSG